MKIYRFDFKNTPQINDKLTLCLGYFDGLHIGHKSLINFAKEKGEKVGLLTFTSSFKKNDKNITTLEDKIYLLEKEGIDSLFIVENTLELSYLNAIDFIDIVLKKINPSSIVVGSDFKFGHFGKGTPDLLSQYFATNVLDLLPFNDHKISSSWIRELVEEGNIELANKLLDKPYSITSRIIKGLGNGSTLLSLPTINIDILDYVCPKFGVYFVDFIVDNKSYHCICNVGIHPSIDELNKPVIEIFLKEHIDISSGGGRVEFLHFHREEKHFGNIEELKNQIQKDVRSMEEYFNM